MRRQDSFLVEMEVEESIVSLWDFFNNKGGSSRKKKDIEKKAHYPLSLTKCPEERVVERNYLKEALHDGAESHGPGHVPLADQLLQRVEGHTHLHANTFSLNQRRRTNI